MSETKLLPAEVLETLKKVYGRLLAINADEDGDNHLNESADGLDELRPVIDYLAQQQPAPSGVAAGGGEIDPDALGRFAQDEWMNQNPGYPAWGFLRDADRAAWLAVGARIKRVLAAPSASPAKVGDKITVPANMLVSVDVSTGEDDAEHRIFARTTGEVVQFTPEGPMDDPVILCIEESRNFAQQPAKVAEGVEAVAWRWRHWNSDGGEWHDWIVSPNAPHKRYETSQYEPLYTTPQPQGDASPQEGRWISSDDVDRLVRDIDVSLNGEAGAAKQAALCDIAGQLAAEARRRGGPILATPQARPDGGECPNCMGIAPETCMFTHPAPAPDVARLVEAASNFIGGTILKSKEGRELREALDPFTAAQQEGES